MLSSLLHLFWISRGGGVVPCNVSWHDRVGVNKEQNPSYLKAISSGLSPYVGVAEYRLGT